MHRAGCCSRQGTRCLSWPPVDPRGIRSRDTRPAVSDSECRENRRGWSLSGARGRSVPSTRARPLGEVEARPGCRSARAPRQRDAEECGSGDHRYCSRPEARHGAPDTTPTMHSLLSRHPRPDRLRKAVATGADAVCLDLEDAVAAGEKDRARHVAIEALASRDRSAPLQLSATSDAVRGTTEPLQRTVLARGGSSSAFTGVGG